MASIGIILIAQMAGYKPASNPSKVEKNKLKQSN
jgi:hypothetical protein